MGDDRAFNVLLVSIAVAFISALLVKAFERAGFPYSIVLTVFIVMMVFFVTMLISLLVWIISMRKDK